MHNVWVQWHSLTKLMFLFTFCHISIGKVILAVKKHTSWHFILFAMNFGRNKSCKGSFASITYIYKQIVGLEAHAEAFESGRYFARWIHTEPKMGHTDCVHPLIYQLWPNWTASLCVRQLAQCVQSCPLWYFAILCNNQVLNWRTAWNRHQECTFNFIVCMHVWAFDLNI